MGPFAQAVLDAKYARLKSDGTRETWEEVCDRVVSSVFGAVRANPELVYAARKLMIECKFIPGGRFLTGAGTLAPYTSNCFLMRAEDTREGWAELLRRVALVSMYGGGCGAAYGAVRSRGSALRRTGGEASGPEALMRMVNEIGRGVMGGGSRRAAMWAGLPWDHDDIHKVMSIKDWSPEVRASKTENVDYPAPLDMTNVSVMLDARFFAEHEAGGRCARNVFSSALQLACRTGEPGFSVSLMGEDLRNTCGEITSDDDSDACCLGSINLARMGSVAEFRSAVEIATAFLLAGTEYTYHPYDKVRRVQSKNRRLGLGLMGIHEWLLTHGLNYAWAMEIVPYLEAYTESEFFGRQWASSWEFPSPVRTRAIAPTGSISILAETTSGIEPIYCSAYQRRYRVGDSVRVQYVLDPVAERLVEGGVSPDDIEDASSLARDLNRRLTVQGWIQQYVDQAISSTINLPAWGSVDNNEDTVDSMETTILSHLPRLRGLTLYPDGARSGQPLTPVPWAVARDRRGKEFIEGWSNICAITGRGTCGE